MADLLRGDPENSCDDPDAPDNDLPVLEENWDAVQVFLICQPTYAGMAAAMVGIAATEIMSAVRLLGVPCTDWSEVTFKVHYMSRHVARAQAEQRNH